jgi:hypothetical protein
MNDDAKIHLSPQEMELVNNSEWILTKQGIMKKAHFLLGELHHNYKKIVETEKEFLPADFQKPGGKISKGENYLGLPFLILDYPALFSKENIYAIRTMFWWGNFFSISLHLSGKYFSEFKNPRQWILFFQQKGFHICVSENEWEHDFSTSNFMDIKEISEAQLQNIFKKNFFKVAKKIKLNEWNEVPEFLEESFKEIIQFIKISFHPNGETAL